MFNHLSPKKAVTYQLLFCLDACEQLEQFGRVTGWPTQELLLGVELQGALLVESQSLGL